jgi:tetratricopeptide (TPR) repeat protein
LRASGGTEEALALYRAQLDRDATDALARTGVILTLFDAGKREEAERELTTALAASAVGSTQSAPVVEAPPSAQDNSQPAASTPPLALLVGAAYWYATQMEGNRSLELADRAVAAEPRYTWAHIARARALLALRRPAEAELTLRLARGYGDFPTLTYELANVLAALGFYDEAATNSRATSVLPPMGKSPPTSPIALPCNRPDFIALLAPERRAAILQPRAAASIPESEQLRNLLAFHTALNRDEPRPLMPASTRRARLTQRATLSAATLNNDDFLVSAISFAAGDDDMRFFRQLYALEHLLDESATLASSTVADKYDRLLAISEAMPALLDAALAAPAAAHATLAAELRDARRRRIAAGDAPPNPPAVETRKLAVILRGRLEIVAGRLLLNAGRAEEASVRLQRAVSILPPATEWRRTAHYYLGSAHETTGKNNEALDAYLQSYDPQRPNNLRRLAIETLYRKVNGSLDGLDTKLQNAGR